MRRRTVTIVPEIDQLINFARGFFLLTGHEYNYTEIVNHAILYGFCYWLGVEPEKALEMATQYIGSGLEMEGIEDELGDKLSTLFPTEKKETSGGAVASDGMYA